MTSMVPRSLRLLSAVVLCSAAAGVASAQTQKSAQSDCAREAARRGYQVVSTEGFRQLPQGWSLELRLRDARGALHSATCVVDGRTGNVTLQGLGLAGGGTQQKVEFDCLSIKGTYRECQLPLDGRVRLVKRYSNADCIEGTTWGLKRDRVWVSKGCRARFAVDPGGWPGAGGGGGGQSQQQAQSKCRVRAEREGMRVERVSSAEWNPGQRFWLTTIRGTYRGQRITAGCRWYPERDRFEMNFGSGWSAGSNDVAAAQRACTDEAQRRGYRVVRGETPYPTQSGYGMQLELRRGNAPNVEAYCRYDTRTNRVELEVYGAGRSASASL